MKRTFLFAIVCLLIAACTQVPHEILSTVEDLSGTYYGSAKVLERLERDGVIALGEVKILPKVTLSIKQKSFLVVLRLQRNLIMEN
ncbi:MAG: hypothetical protein AAFP02_05130, partial [Bacteroidota bacterium]